MISILDFKIFFKRFPSHWLTTVSAWASKIIVSLVQIISIRSLLVYLDTDRYAVYIIAFSLTLWFNLSEFGIGSSLQNFISEARAKNESYEKYIIAMLQMITVLFVILVFFILFISEPIQNFLFKKFEYIQEVQSSRIVFFMGIICISTSLLSIVHRLYYALHKGYIANIAPAIAAIISMISIFLFNRYSPIRQSILIALLIFTLPQLFITLIFFIVGFKNYFKKILNFNFRIIKLLLLRALKFHGITILSLVYGQTDYIIMSQTLSSNEIVLYNIFIRVFMFFTFLHISLIGSFWPVSTEMFIKKEFIKIKNAIKRYLTGTMIFMIIGTVLVLIFSKLIIKILAPSLNVTPTISLILLFGAYIIIKAWQDTFYIFLQAMNVLRIFWIYMPFQLFLNISMQYLFSKKYGSSGILLGFIISILLTSLWILPLKMYKVLKESSKDDETKY